MPRVSVVGGICLPPDAISYSMLRDVEALRDLFGATLRLRCFVYAHSVADPDFVAVHSAGDLILDRHFMTSDLVLFHFGIFYGLFDTIFLLPNQAVKIVRDHNITPEALLSDSQQIEAVRKANAQRANCQAATEVWSDSDYNRQILIEAGIPGQRCKVLPIPLADHFSPDPAPRQGRTGAPRLIYVGRYVHSKGVADLVRAFTRARRQGMPTAQLSLAGSHQFADAEYLHEVRRLIADHPFAGEIDLIGEVSPESLLSLYRRSDVLVIPSYHEGFCLPVIEALSQGCFVIGYDAANLPGIMGGFGWNVPTGNVDQLACAIQQAVSSLTNGDRLVHNTDQLRAHLSAFTYAQFRENMRALLVGLGLI